MKARAPITRRLAEWAAGLVFEDIPPNVLYEAKSQILSVLGASYAGAEVASPVLRAVRAWGGPGEAAILSGGERTSPELALYANCALSMALDYDDYLFAGHTGHSAVLVPYALAASAELSGRDWLLAQVVANEIEGRVGASVLIGPQNGQLWSFIHAAGAAAAAARLRGADAETIASALGVALYQPPYGLFPGFMKSEAKLLTAATAACQGLRAADLALAGLAGNAEIIETPGGFLDCFSFAPLPSMYDGLGSRWLTETLSYKVYPGCAYIDAFVDAALAIAGRDEFDAGEVESIDVAASLLTVKMDALSRPHLRGPDSSPVTLNFSVPYNAAVALLDGELTPRQLRPERIRDPEVWALAGKVRLRHDPRWSARMRAASGAFVPMGEIAANARAELLPYVLRQARWDDLRDLFRPLARPAAWRALASGALRPRSKSALGLARADLSAYRMSFGATVTVRLKGGRKLREARETPRGAAGEPPEAKRAEAARKFLREAEAAGISKETRERVLGAVESLEAAGPAELAELCRLLPAPPLRL